MNELLVERIAAVTHDVVDRRYTADAGLCLLTTNVLLRALDYFGIPAKPQKVAASIFNPVAAEWVYSGRDIDANDGADCLEAGGWIVQIDTTSDNPGRYAGHLVAIADDRYLIDASFSQFSRPAKGIIVPATAAFDLAGQDWPAEQFAAQIGESVVLYRDAPESPDFRHSANWRASVAKPLAGAVIREVRDQQEVAS